MWQESEAKKKNASAATVLEQNIRGIVRGFEKSERALVDDQGLFLYCNFAVCGVNCK